MTNETAFDIIASAIQNEQLQKMTVEELDQIALFSIDVDLSWEVDELGLGLDAEHGENTIEEMMQTYA